MNEDNRATAMVGLWALSGVVLAALYISAAAQGELTQGHIFLTMVILACAVGGTAFVTRLKGSQHPEKAKRRRMDSLLHELSDDELIELKRRLSDVDFDEGTAADSLMDDDEKSRRRSS